MQHPKRDCKNHLFFLSLRQDEVSEESKSDNHPNEEKREPKVGRAFASMHFLKMMVSLVHY